MSSPDDKPSSTPPPPQQEPSILVDLTHQEHQRVTTAFPSQTGRKLAIGVVALAVVLCVGFFVVQYHRSQHDADLKAAALAAAQAPVAVDVVAVKPSPVTRTITRPGRVSAWYETTIYARVSGYLLNWSADIGDRVTKGQVLATIETPELDDQLAAAEAKLEVSQANVTVAEAEASFAKATYDRYWNLPVGPVSQEERDEKKAEYDSSLAKLEAAKSQVNLDSANVKNLKELSGFKQVLAPYDGVITARRIDIGDLVTAGSTASTTSLYSIAQYDKVRVFADVPEDTSADMTVGTAATVTVGELPDRKFEGKLERTASAIDPASLSLHVEVDVPNQDLTLLPGMFGEVNFEIKQRPLLEIPANALMDRAEGLQVAVVDASGKVRFRNVTIETDQGDHVTVASGLTAGDRVAVNLSNQVADGDHVQVSAEDKPTTTAGSVASATNSVATNR